MADQAQLGHQLRGLRAAAGRTVASVASDAGLSVPYIANLENGRGNPTISALDRLAAALGARLEISLSAADPPAVPAAMPASLVRFGRSDRFRHDTATLAGALGVDPAGFGVQLVTALGTLAAALGVDVGESGWARLMDALLLIIHHPAPRPGA